MDCFNRVLAPGRKNINFIDIHVPRFNIGDKVCLMYETLTNVLVIEHKIKENWCATG